MSTRIDHYNNNGGNGGGGGQPSPNSPTASFAPAQSTSFPPRSSSMRQLPAPTTTNGHSNGSNNMAQDAVSLDPAPGTTYAQFLRTWTDAHVARWLVDNKCGHQAQTFSVNDIRGDILLELDQTTLKEMGISSIGDRLRIMNALKALRQKCSSRVIVSPVVDTSKVTVANHSRTPSSIDSSGSPTSKPGSNSTRRLEAGRPAPLQIPRESSQGLPRLDRAGDSSRPRPLPFPTPTTATPQSYSMNGSGGASSSSSSLVGSSTPQGASGTPISQSGRGQGLQPQSASSRTQPGSTAVRQNGRNVNLAPNHGGYRTPTNAELNTYNNAPLPPAPGPPPAYGLPADPRPGNLGGTRTPVRSNSPLNGTTARDRNNNLSPDAASAHARNTSLDKLNGVGIPGPSKLPLRSVHPYAAAQQLPLPPSGAINLSPINEGFASQPGSSSNASISAGLVAGRTPSPPNAAYTVGRGPFRTPNNANAGNANNNAGGPSLDELRRKVLKFSMFEQNQTRTIDVSNASSGLDVIEKALKKFGLLHSQRPLDAGDVTVGADGGMAVDGWGAFLDWDNQMASSPLSEQDLLTICHAPSNDPVKDRGLSLRRVNRAGRRGQYDGLGVSRQSPTSPYFDQNQNQNQNQLDVSSQAAKMMRRASSISILSGLGVQDPERILEPFSPTQMYGGPPDTPTIHAYAQAQVQPPTPDAYDSYGSYAPYPPEVPPKVQAGAAFPTASPTPPGKLSHFPGQRPPSELVTTHMAAYFPGAEKKVLERARRMSMLKPHTSMLGGKRDSVASFATGTGVGTMGSGGAMGGRPNPRFSRFSVSTQGSVPRPNSPRGSTISGISGMSNEGMAPRVSLSTDDGQSLDLQPAYSSGGDTDSLSAERDRRSESRQSMYSQYRTKKDKEKKDVSDTASLMTVDQITAEVVESRRASTLLEPESTSSDEWTKVSVGGESEETLTPSDSNGTGESTDEEEDEEEEEEDWAEGSRWIKGALIGAGAFGQVYLGMDAETGILMAVKQVELPKDSTPNAERKKAMLTALEHEIALLEEFRHQHIVQYLHSALDEEYLNIFLEYVPGGSITALLRNYGAFEETLVKTFLRQILRGLEYLHEKDVIHRDIKGANILVDNKGTVKISDFGISKKGGAAIASGGRANRPSLQGSVFWMAPEVVKQTAHSPKADIWSVGCLVVEMFTGEHPWANLTQMQAIFRIGASAKPEIPADISPEAQDFLALTFDLDYEKRPSATECLQHPWLALSSKKGSKLKPPPPVVVES